MKIVPAYLADAPQVAEIYGHYVLHSTASFELEPPSAAEIASRMAAVQRAGWPWLVARDDAGGVLGYAYASQFRDRPAYRFACENSVYVRPHLHRQGIGRALMAALIAAAETAGFRQMIAVIAGAAPASAALHQACGFAEAGRMCSVGRKHGQWLDTLYMQRALDPGDTAPPADEPR